MLRAKLLTATAAVALFAASSAFAQDAMTAPQAAPTETPAAAAATPATEAAAPAAATPAAATPAAPAATQTAAATPAASDTIIDELKANGQFTTLLAALDAAQLTDTLKTQPEISIFAPTDAAFAQLPEAERTRLMDPANVNELRQLLLYHVVVADVNSSQIKGTKGPVETAARTQLQLDGTGDAIKVDEATVTTADIAASNGAIFAIDKVLMPQDSQVASGDAEEATTAAPAPAADAMEAPQTPAEAAPAPAEAAPMTEAAPAAPMTDAAPAAPAAPMTEAAPAAPAAPMTEAAPAAPMAEPAPAAPMTETTPAPEAMGPPAPAAAPAPAAPMTEAAPAATPTDEAEGDDEAEDAAPVTPTPQS